MLDTELSEQSRKAMTHGLLGRYGVDVLALVAEVRKWKAEACGQRDANTALRRERNEAQAEVVRLRAALDDVIGDLEEVAQKTDDYRARDFAKARAKDHRTVLASSEIQEGK